MTSVIEVEEETFNGSRVVEVYWRGQVVKVVEGQFAYRLAKDARTKSAMPDAATLGAAVVRGAARADDRGIGILYSDPDLLERDEGLAVLEAPEFDWIEPLMLDYGCAVNDPRRSQQWTLDAIEADAAWALQKSSEGVVLAILDSGVPLNSAALSHEDLSAARINLGPNVLASGLPLDDHGHGTHVAGVAIAERDNGLGIAGLWNGSVYIVKVLDKNKAGTAISFNSGVRHAIDFARAANARLVVNYSAAGGDSKSKRDAVAQLKEYGAVLVAAAGNSGGGPVEYPAAYSATDSNVIAVSALNDQNERAPFSSRGPEVTVSAPGAGIVSALPNYAVTLTGSGKALMYDVLDGTSQAAPAVAAVTAMLWAQSLHLTAADVRAKIVASATKLPGGDPEDVGAGIVNAHRALL